MAIRRRPSRRTTRTTVRTTLREIGEGLRFVRANAWCGATLLGYSVGLLASRGPVQVLLPFAVKNTLHAGPTGPGFILATGGVGSMAAAFLAGQRGLPRQRVVAMCAQWALSFLGIAGYGLMTVVWQGLLITFAISACYAFGIVIWSTLLQTRVPRALLGRVSSVDWLSTCWQVPAAS